MGYTCLTAKLVNTSIWFYYYCFKNFCIYNF